ncbi:MAG TPA: beta-ketoacyl synthase N-terminal-like domain-containing protein [Ignavibacteria bacterium]
MKELFDLERKNSLNKIIVNTNKEDIREKDIAIVGISVKLPMINNLLEFENILKYKIDTIGELSDRRKLDIGDYLKSKGLNKEIKFKKGSFLDEIDEFDYSLFKITPVEAKLMNPIQRSLLQSTYSALDDAGYANKNIRGKNVGVFVGFIDIDYYKYKDMIIENESKTNIDLSVIGNLNSMIPSRISYYLNLKGPSLLIDTACSSSLVAVHEACKSIINGDCESALVGSGRINILPVEDDIRIGIESEKLKVRTFDRDADGTCIGEGIISIYLKPLKSAIKDKDNIYAVIKGSAVNQDGATMGITAPSSEAQKEVILKAWKNSEIDPEDIEAFESHGTATKIGDVIELEAISNAFKQHTEKKQFCAISSIKSNIGHLYDCAGLASLVKAAIQLKNKELLPTANFEYPNAKIKFENLPVYINNEFKDWNSSKNKRICGVSSFGFSGTNAHLILEEFKCKEISEIESSKNYMLTLSGKTHEKLLEQIKLYRNFIISEKRLNIDNFCYTANKCKEVFDKKIVIIFKDKEDLADKFEQLIFKKDFKEEIIIDKYLLDEKANELRQLLDIGEKYLKNEEIVWEEIYKGEMYCKISIPPYSFTRKRCWIDIKEKTVINHGKFFGIDWVKQEVDNVRKDEISGPILFIREEASKVVDEIVKSLEYKDIKVFELIVNNINEIEGSLINEDDLWKIREVDNIVYALSTTTTVPANLYDVKKIQNQGLFGFTKFIQELGNLNLEKNPSIIILSDRSVIENTTVHGIGLVASLEYSNFNFKGIEFDLETDPKALINEILIQNSCYQLVSYRNNERYIQKLEYLKANSFIKTDFRDESTYIITGGLGFLGGIACNYISNKCKGNIVILGRKELSCDMLENNSIFKEVRSKGNNVEYISVDIANFDKLKEVIDGIRLKYKNISGVIHSAGTGNMGLIMQKNIAEIESVICAKVYGTWNLLNILKNDAMEFFMMFSSGLTMLGEYGQGAYVAGNAYLDSVSYCKSNNIKRLTTINWPVVKGGGIAEEYNYENKLFKGIDVVEIKETLDYAFSRDVNRIIVGEFNNRVKVDEIVKTIPIMVSDEILNYEKTKAVEDVNESALTEKSGTQSISFNCDDSYEKVLDNILDSFTRITGIEDAEIDTSLMEMGIDSILFTKLHSEINTIYPGIISISQMFSFSNLEKVASYIYEHIEKLQKENKKKEKDNEKNISNNLSEIFERVDKDEISLEDMIKEIEGL